MSIDIEQRTPIKVPPHFDSAYERLHCTHLLFRLKLRDGVNEQHVMPEPLETNQPLEHEGDMSSTLSV
jgi:hypothetical protein